MVTELSIKSPLPGIDGMWGRGRWGVSTKERGWRGGGGSEGAARHGAVVSSGSFINRDMRRTKGNTAARVT